MNFNLSNTSATKYKKVIVEIRMKVAAFINDKILIFELKISNPA